MISTAIQQLVNYGLDTGLILPDDEIYIRNQLLMTMQLDDFTAPEGEVCYTDLESILKTLVDDAVARGVCEDNSTARDLFDTKLMGVLTPRPSIVRANFEERYESEGPQAATDWFYKFSQDTDYIRRYRIKRDLKWVTKTPYGDLDITINLSKPEKDPKAIAAAKLAPQSAYPKCQLCAENEGYAGRMNHPARENHRIIPHLTSHYLLSLLNVFSISYFVFILFESEFHQVCQHQVFLCLLCFSVWLCQLRNRSIKIISKNWNSRSGS